MLARSLLFLSLTWSTEAHAQWRVPPSCPDRADAEDRLEELGVSRTLFARGAASVRIDTAPSGELRARVGLPHGERRELYDRRCDSLAEAALLVISLAFEHEPVEAQRASEPRTIGLSLAPIAKLDLGSLPALSWGVGAALRMRASRVSVELEGSYFGARELEHGDVRGSFGLSTGAGRACYALVARWFAGCAALELGRASGRTVQAPHRGAAHGLWIAALLGLELSVPTRHLQPVVDLELGFPLQRESFEIEQAGPLFVTGHTIGRGSLRLAFDLL